MDEHFATRDCRIGFEYARGKRKREVERERERDGEREGEKEGERERVCEGERERGREGESVRERACAALAEFNSGSSGTSPGF